MNGTVIPHGRQPTDLVTLWGNAFSQYNQHIGDGPKIDIRRDQVTELGDVIKEVKEDASLLHHRRHPPEKLDKVRSAIRENLGWAQFVGDQLAKAVSTSFPAASPIWTVASYAIKAAQRMSADYDRLEDLFAETGSFLKTLRILEGSVPDNVNYVQNVTDIIESIVVVFAIQTRYMRTKRAVKFLSSLVKGEDPELANAYDNVTKAIGKLSASSVQMTLRNTEDIKSFLWSRQEEVETWQQKVSSQFDVINEKLDLNLRRFDTFQQETSELFTKEFAKEREFITKTLGSHGKQNLIQNKDPVAKVTAATNEVKSWCASQLKDSTWYYSDIKPATLTRDFGSDLLDTGYSWFFDREPYKPWAEGRLSTLLLHGAPGIGKSVLGNFVADRVQRTDLSELDKRISARFHFQQAQANTRSIKNCLLYIALQIAKQDGHYCEQVASCLRSGTKLYEEANNLENIWTELFAKRFHSKSSTRLFLVIDGLDEVEEGDAEALVGLLSQVSSDQLNISILLTCRSEMLSTCRRLQPEIVEITTEVLAPDIKLFARKRCRSLSRISKFSKETKRAIVNRMKKVADGMLYVDLALHQLDHLGRERPVRNALEKLPAGLEKLFYQTMSEIYQSRPTEYHQILKTLYAWLAYSSRPLSIKEANWLVSHALGSDTFRVEDEVHGHSARLLHLRIEADDDSDDGGDADDDPYNEDTSDDTSSNASEPDAWGSLYFQERSFRDFLKAQDVKASELTMPPFEAHLMMMEALVDILCTERDMNADSSKRDALEDYASEHWDWHFTQLSPDEPTESQVSRVISAVSRVLRNENKALQKVENSGRDWREDVRAEGRCAIRRTAFQALTRWAELASASTCNLDPGVQHWLENLQREPKSVLFHLGQCHVSNWRDAVVGYKANDAFEYALATLKLGELASISDSSRSPWLHTIEEIEKVAHTFEGLQDDVGSHRALALELHRSDHHQRALDECDRALAFSCSDKDRLLTLVLKAQVHLEFPDDKRNHSMQALKQIDNAFELRNSAFPITSALTEQDRDMFFEAWRAHAEIEVELEKYDSAVASYDQAAKVAPYVGPYILRSIVEVLYRKNDYGAILARINGTKQDIRKRFLGWYGDQQHACYQEAAKKSGKSDLDTLVRNYEEAITSLDRSKSSGELRYRLATFYRRVRGDNEASKSKLAQILDSDTCKNAFGNDSVWALVEARFNYAEIIHTQFACSTDLAYKATLLDELKALPKKSLGQSFGIDVEYSSNTSVILARMVRKIGPAKDFYDIVQKIFQVCFEGLTDATTANDGSSLRLFARLLALMGLQRDACIALSSVFYSLDPSKEPATTKKQTEATQLSSEADTEVKVTASAEEIPYPEIQASSSHVEEKTTPKYDHCDYYVVCDGCDAEFTSWEKGPFYLCAICASCDLCPSCRDKRIAQNNGAPNDSWRTFCDFDHEYIKGPVEGWKGIKDGVLIIGEEKLPFQEWLRALKEERWVKAWEDYWRGA